MELSILDTPPDFVQEEMKELIADLDISIPPKRLDRNLLIATWNIRAFGDLTREWHSTPGQSPRRDLASVLAISEIISRFDVIAIQEAKSNLRSLRDTLKKLGENWSMILTDVTRGAAGNDERMAFLFDTRRVKLSGLACELVVPSEWTAEIDENALIKQFARTPYAVGFRSCNHTFVLVTLHILFGKKEKERLPELKAIARWMADWARRMNDYEQNFIAMGDFNIEERGDLLSQTFLSEGLFIPNDLEQVTRSIFDETKFYDHIAWFNGAKGIPQLSLRYLQGGNYDFVGKALKNKNLTKKDLSWHMSDHYPLWAEFSVV